MLLRKKISSSLVLYSSYIVPLIVGLAIKDPIFNWYTHLTHQNRDHSLDHFPPLSQQLEVGIALQHQGNTAAAMTAYRTALQSIPEVPRLLLHLAQSYAATDNHQQAIDFYQTALAIEPHFVNGYLALAMSYMQLRQYDRALQYLQKAHTLTPHNAQVHSELSRVYMDTAAYDLAITHAEKAYELEPTNIHTMLNLGHVNNKKGDLETATHWYTQALKLDPHCANAHYNLGYTLRIMKKPHQALHHLRQAEQLKPDYVDAHIALAQVYWGLQQYELAWKEYEWRWKLMGVDPYALSIPLWDGSDLQGKTILLYCEQGLGDTIQFIRYAKLVKDKGGYIICKIQKPLIKLLESYQYVDQYITSEQEIRNIPINYQSPLLNLPGIFKTNHTTIPAPIPYLKAQKSLIKKWNSVVQKKPHTINIGLCWHVDPEHELDKSPWAKRSITLSSLYPLAKIPGTRFYSLQKINGEDQLKNIPEDFHIHTFGYAFDQAHGRFMDTAAVIANLDLIITVDTSIAHIAGAMGKPVWMLLPYSPDPRWYDEGEKTPWYPTMRLFRQHAPGNWHRALQTIMQELKKTPF